MKNIITNIIFVCIIIIVFTIIIFSSWRYNSFKLRYDIDILEKRIQLLEQNLLEKDK